MVKDCPKCGLVNPPSAQRCDCGYDFVSRTVEHSYLGIKDRELSTEMTAGETLICIFLPFIGFILGIRALRRRPVAGRNMMLISGALLAVGIALRLVIWGARQNVSP